MCRVTLTKRLRWLAWVAWFADVDIAADKSFEIREIGSERTTGRLLGLRHILEYALCVCDGSSAWIDQHPYPEISTGAGSHHRRLPDHA